MEPRVVVLRGPHFCITHFNIHGPEEERGQGLFVQCRATLKRSVSVLFAEASSPVEQRRLALTLFYQVVLCRAGIS